MAYKVSAETAQRALALLAHHGDDAGAAAYGERIGLTAIEPYRNERGERIEALLSRLAVIDRKSPERGQRWREALAEIAQGLS